MASLASINVAFTSDLKQFSTSMQNAERQLNKIGSKFKSVGKNLSIGLTAPIVALGTASVIAFDKQAKAIAQVEAGLKSTGNTAGKTSEELQKLASELQSVSLFGDEEILKDVTAQLLTFTNIAGTQFDRTQQAALDLATRLDGDLKSASIQLGKALNDPIANLSALSRSGIQFSQDQKAVIKSLTETGRLAEAQTIILDELEKQYGGAAAAAAAAGLGPFKQLQNSIGDLTEDFGKIITEALVPVINYIRELVDRFKNLDAGTKKTIVVVAALAAAIGPVIAAVGVLMTALPALGAAFAVLTGPIGLVVAALAGIGLVVYKYWGPIKEFLIDIANYFIDLYNESTVFRAGVESVALVFKNLWQTAVFAFDVMSSALGSFVDQFKNSFKNLGDLIKAVLTGNFDAIPAIIRKNLNQGIAEFSDFRQKVAGDWEKFTEGIKQNGKDALENTFRGKIEFIPQDVNTEELENEIEKAVATAAGSGLSEGLVGSQSATIIEPIDTQPLIENLELINGYKEGINSSFSEITESGLRFNESMTAILSQTAESFAVGFGQLIATAVQGGNFAKGLFALMVDTFGNMMIQLGKAAIGIGTTIESIKQGFKDVSGIGPIIAGIALIALGQLAKTVVGNIGAGGDSTPFANGGIVYGPTRALVGEYAGARNNPEVIAPLNKLKNLINPVGEGGTTAVQLEGEFVLRGNDLVQLVKRVENRNNRTQ